MGAATAYTARDQAAAGTQASPKLLNVNVGDPLQRATNADNVSGGHVAIATIGGKYGGVDRPNSN